jgi:outer membrane protein TolC
MNTIRFLVFFILGLFLQLQSAHSQDVLVLDRAIRAALEHNHGILISKDRLAKLENDKSMGNAGMLPTIGMDASRNYSITDVNQTFQDGRKLENNGIKANNYTVAARLEWTLFDGFEMFMMYDRLDKLRQLGQIQLRSQVEGTIADLTTTYYNLGRQQKLIRSLEASIDISQQRLKIAEDKLDVGSGARVEVLQARVALNEDRSALKNQQLLRVSIQETLGMLMGLRSGSEFIVDETIGLDQNLSYEVIYGSAMKNNPELIGQRLSLSLSKQMTKMLQSQRLPSIALNSSYTFTGSENRAGFFVEQNNQGLNYGLTARVSLFNGFNVNRTLQNARIDEKIAQTEVERVELMLESNLIRVYTEYTTALELINLEEQNVLVAKDNAAIALERFELGTYTPIELREAQQALLNTEIRLASAMYAAKSSEIQLKFLSGRITSARD